MNTMIRILVVDDEEGIRESLQEILAEDGYAPAMAQDADEARARLEEGADLVLLDIRLGEDNGIELLKEIKAARPSLPVIMISGHGTVALAAEAFRLGAHDFLEKPLRLVKIRTTIRNALEAVSLRHQVTEHARQKMPRALYQSSEMTAVYRQVDRLAVIAEPVVVLGPSGSGKELVAQALHYHGPRGDGPFIATNAASLPVNLAEDELFGHEKGAFTGAQTARKGCLEQADGGTLFLDEIADMDVQIQAKLLRVLETGSFNRLGGSKPVTVNVRIVAATHKDLALLAQNGSFRHDLWYRLCAFVVTIPPLADRRDDIPLLAEHFLKANCIEMGIQRSLSPEALDVLQHADYPGNIRELKHVITRVAVFSDRPVIDGHIVEMMLGTAGQQPLPASTTGSPYASMDFRSAREQFERDYLDSALKRNDSNITATAADIGMAQSNLSRKLKDLGIR